MNNLLSKAIFGGLLILFALLVFSFFNAVQAYNQPRSSVPSNLELQEALALTRQRLFAVEQRVKALEARNPAGEIRVYKVDTAAGTLECRSCRFEETK